MLFSSHLAFSEDIDLYLGDDSVQTGPKPQVLIIFDNSGSMNTNEEVKADYDPDTVYPAVGGLNSLSDKFIYFTKGGVDNSALPTPDSPSESRRFLDAINSCDTAREILAEQGIYTGYIREYAFSGNTGSWQEIPDNNGANIEVIDCKDDVINNDPDNAIGPDGNLPDGFPANGLGTKKNPIYHTANASDSDVTWSGQVVTLYTDNYLRWASNEDIATQNKSRLAVAKDAVTTLIRSAPFAEFGLQIFNYDHPGENVRDGGRIVFGIQEMDAAARTKLIDIIDLEIDGETNTPLCETLYEASLYFGGKAVDFGDNDSNYKSSYKGNTPPRDTSIEESGSYKTPFTCNDDISVIIITDGKPTRDLAADTKIKALSGIGSPFDVDGTNNYLAALAGWMHNNDINDDVGGEQNATTYTIGFGKDAINDAGALLRETAKLGGGEYFPAEDSAALASALQSAISAIGNQASTLTSASVASNNFDRTETLDSVYYAMFTPDNGARWEGNIKKYRIDGDTQYDANDKAAVTSDGVFSDNAQSFWSSGVDGNKVSEGGVAEMLRKKSSRNIYSNIGANGALKNLTKAELIKADAYGSEDALATEMDVAVDDLDDYINWARGIDVDDEDGDTSTTDMRYDVFGDPLHSKPLVVNYGGDSESTQEIRLIVGTNAGVLHMFDDNGNSVDEAWAFMPKEFLSDVKTLRENFSYSSKVYGVDGPVTSHVYDANGDGKIDESVDKVWIFFGLRRGGNSFYAVDITKKDSPKLLWHIDASSTGFTDLGQSWSKPKIGYSALNIVDDVPKPVLFFGGGYDINKDDGGVGDSDTVGLGAYMVDAESGKLLWTLSNESSSATNTYYAGADSIPAPVGILDSDGNGLVDRLYLGDTGGNVWRVDMPGASPNSSSTPWTAFKLASVGGDTDATDRRFFYEPSIARALITDTVTVETKDEHGEIVKTVTQQERPYEAILISSGDRPTPLAADTDDGLFMFKDENVITQSFSSSISPANPAPNTINHKATGDTDLYDYTDNPFGKSLTADQLEQLHLAVSAKSGWYIDLTEDGEKGTAAAIAINGVAYYTSYVPPANVEFDEETCKLEIIGGGFLYAVDLLLGTSKYNWSEAQANRDDGQGRIITVGNEFADTPTIVVTPDSDASVDSATTLKIVTGKQVQSTNATITTTRTSLYVEETEQ